MLTNVQKHKRTQTPTYPRASDTSPEAERVQIELLRRATTSQRAGMALGLSHQAVTLSQRAIRRANPDLPEREIERLFVTLHYGEDIYNKLVKPRLKS